MSGHNRTRGIELEDLVMDPKLKNSCLKSDDLNLRIQYLEMLVSFHQMINMAFLVEMYAEGIDNIKKQFEEGEHNHGNQWN